MYLNKILTPGVCFPRGDGETVVSPEVLTGVVLSISVFFTLISCNMAGPGRPSEIPKRKNRQYSAEDLSTAIKKRTNKSISLRKAVGVTLVPKSTLHRHVTSPNLKKVGQPNALSDETERALAYVLDVVGQWGYPVDREGTKDIVKGVLDGMSIQHPRFINNRPGKKWLLG